VLTQQQRATVALIGGAVVASVVCVVVKRYVSLRGLRMDIDTIPWDKKEFTWKDYFTGYKSDFTYELGPKS